MGVALETLHHSNMMVTDQAGKRASEALLQAARGPSEDLELNPGKNTCSPPNGHPGISLAG